MTNVKINGLVKVKAARQTPTHPIIAMMTGEATQPSHAMAEGSEAIVMYVSEEGGVVVKPPRGSIVVEGGQEEQQYLEPEDFEVIEEGDGNFEAAVYNAATTLYPQDGEVNGYKVGDSIELVAYPPEIAPEDFPMKLGTAYKVVALDEQGPIVIFEEGSSSVVRDTLSEYTRKAAAALLN